MRPLRVELLEGRALLATFTVTSPADSGPGSLREAIGLANANSDPDVIAFDPAVTGTISPSGDLPALSAPVNLRGPGAADLTVAGRLVVEATGGQVRISGLTFRGVSNSGTLAVVDSRISGADAGGVTNTGLMTISRTVISGNSDGVYGIGDPILHPGRDGVGGGIRNAGVMAISASAIAGNSVIPGGRLQVPRRRRHLQRRLRHADHLQLDHLRQLRRQRRRRGHPDRGR